MALGAFATLGTSRTYADEQKIQYNQEFQTPSYIGEEWKAPEGLD